MQGGLLVARVWRLGAPEGVPAWGRRGCGASQGSPGRSLVVLVPAACSWSPRAFSGRCGLLHLEKLQFYAPCRKKHAAFFLKSSQR